MYKDIYLVEKLYASENPPLLPNHNINSPKFNFADVKFLENVRGADTLPNLISSITCTFASLFEKVAAIFYWLSHMHENRAIFEAPSLNSEECHFNKLFSMANGKPLSFEYMCRFICVPCCVIKGIVRNINDNPRDKYIVNHTWNCVYIEGFWYLCDLWWSSRVISVVDINDMDNISRESVIKVTFSPDYFMATPLKFRSTHFPSFDTKFQLLSNIITFDQFCNLPILTEIFNDSNLGEKLFNMSPLITNNGFSRITIPFECDDCFFHIMEYYDEKLKKITTKMENNEDLKKYSILELANNNINLYCRFPKTGQYYFTLFVQDKSKFGFNCQFNALMKWKIQCNFTTPKPLPFYGYYDICWGPSLPHLRHYGLVPVNLLRGVVRIEYSPPVYMEASFNKLDHDIVFVAKVRGSEKLQPSDYKSIEADGCQLNMVNGTSLDFLIDDEDDIESEVSFTIRLPTYGEYSLEIFANNPKEGDIFHLVAQYMFDLKKDKCDLINRTE